MGAFLCLSWFISDSSPDAFKLVCFCCSLYFNFIPLIRLNQQYMLVKILGMMSLVWVAAADVVNDGLWQLQRLVYQAGSLPTKVICLSQAINEDELKEDEEYEDILDDMRGEGEKYGKLVNVVIPRPGPNNEPYPGVGKVFLEYADTDASSKARQALNGRKFGGNTVVAVFYPENKFAQGEYA
ncbi:splicing factor U2af large subunit B-like isoform X2 [Dioscorea cayenensis subsp. rotundata]|uniref:Splicing factor U2af large subunit B-like isoform X2 n=1 Tax=Dioscorea cayennensis subsp. rotundata TaxID=55577 RepID=A0AB40CP08_DIOCR|nr:splicing factor U2af large subunit B-like isoform X2 [Dioscorea cayenensis subsp. rotundata]